MLLKKLYDDLHCLTNADLDSILHNLGKPRIGNKSQKVKNILHSANTIGKCIFHLFDDQVAENLNLNTVNFYFNDILELKTVLSKYYFGSDKPFIIEPLEMSESRSAPFTRNEFLELTDVSLKTLRQWYDIGYLSFDLLDLNSYNLYHIKEVIFIKKLKEQVISHDYLTKMLNQLIPPYIYSLKEIFWDFDDESWKSKFDLKKNIEDSEFFLPQFYNTIRDLAEENKLDAIYELNNKIVLILNEYEEEFEGENDEEEDGEE